MSLDDSARYSLSYNLNNLSVGKTRASFLIVLNLLIDSIAVASEEYMVLYVVVNGIDIVSPFELMFGKANAYKKPHLTFINIFYLFQLYYFIGSLV